jgi:hypothetical protein
MAALDIGRLEVQQTIAKQRANRIGSTRLTSLRIQRSHGMPKWNSEKVRRKSRKPEIKVRDEALGTE